MLFHVFNFYAQYNNTYEEKLFKTIKNKNEIDAFDILNGIGYNEKLYSKGKNEIEVFVKEIKTSKFETRSLKRKIKIIYKKAHLKF